MPEGHWSIMHWNKYYISILNRKTYGYTALYNDLTLVLSLDSAFRAHGAELPAVTRAHIITRPVQGLIVTVLLGILCIIYDIPLLITGYRRPCTQP